MEAARKGLIPPHTEHPSLVLCGVPTERHLANLLYKLEDKGIPHIHFREPDRNNELTALATAPLEPHHRHHLRNLNLLDLDKEGATP